MAKKKSIRVDFVKSCITYNKLNKIAISGIENVCKRLNEKLEIKKSPAGQMFRFLECNGRRSVWY